MSAEQKQFRADVYLQVLNKIQTVEDEKRKQVIATLEDVVTIEDLKLMPVEAVMLCSKYLSTVKIIEVAHNPGGLEVGVIENSLVY